MSGVTVLRYEAPQRVAQSVAEVPNIVAADAQRYHPVVGLGLYARMRVQEVRQSDGKSISSLLTAPLNYRLDAEAKQPSTNSLGCVKRIWDDLPRIYHQE